MQIVPFPLSLFPALLLLSVCERRVFSGDIKECEASTRFSPLPLPQLRWERLLSACSSSIEKKAPSNLLICRRFRAIRGIFLSVRAMLQKGASVRLSERGGKRALTVITSPPPERTRSWALDPPTYNLRSLSLFLALRILFNPFCKEGAIGGKAAAQGSTSGGSHSSSREFVGFGGGGALLFFPYSPFLLLLSSFFFARGETPLGRPPSVLRPYEKWWRAFAYHLISRPPTALSPHARMSKGGGGGGKEKRPTIAKFTIPPKNAKRGMFCDAFARISQNR